MNNHFKVIFALLSGAAIGSAVTWHLVKDKYKKIADEEIESVKETFYNNHKSESSEKVKEPVDHTADYERVLGISKENGYTNYSDAKTEGKGKDDTDNSNYIYTITENELGETEFSIESLDYYADEVLVDDVGDIIYDLDMTVGNCLEHFMESEEDAIYIRNEQLKIDYEVLKDPRQYEEVHPSEV